MHIQSDHFRQMSELILSCIQLVLTYSNTFHSLFHALYLYHIIMVKLTTLASIHISIDVCMCTIMASSIDTTMQ